MASMDAQMKRYAEEMQFEKAIEMRDALFDMKKLLEGKNER